MIRSRLLFAYTMPLHRFMLARELAEDEPDMHF